MRGNKDACFTSDVTTWGTPWEFVDNLLDQYIPAKRFYLDVCATKKNSKADYYLGRPDDSLQIDWFKEVGRTVERWMFMNPPYGKDLPLFLDKMNFEAGKGASIVSLLPSRTDTNYWRKFIWPAQHVLFVQGRITFEGAPAAAPFPSLVSIYTKIDLGLERFGLISNKGVRLS